MSIPLRHEKWTQMVIESTGQCTWKSLESRGKPLSLLCMHPDGIPFAWQSVSHKTEFLHAQRYASAGNSDHNMSVCLSVRPSVTRRYCVKTKKASVMISSPSGSRKTLVFWRQISSPNCNGFPRTGASKNGGVRKFSDFLALSVKYLENGSRYGQSYY